MDFICLSCNKGFSNKHSYPRCPYCQGENIHTVLLSTHYTPIDHYSGGW